MRANIELIVLKNEYNQKRIEYDEQSLANPSLIDHQTSKFEEIIFQKLFLAHHFGQYHFQNDDNFFIIV